eukprot:jgi/Mesvir1/26694/Mv20472-RA.1
MSSSSETVTQHPSQEWAIEDLMGTRLLTVALLEPDARERETILNVCAAFVSRGDFFSVVQALRMPEYADLLRGKYGFNLIWESGRVFKFDAPMVVFKGCVQIKGEDSRILWDAYKDALYRCPLTNLIDVESGRCGWCKELPPVGGKHKKCNRCSTTRYCSRVCQLRAYGMHRVSCKIAGKALKKGLQEHLDEANAVLSACSERLGMDLNMRDQSGGVIEVPQAPVEEDDEAAVADVVAKLAEFGVNAEDFSNIIVL